MTTQMHPHPNQDANDPLLEEHVSYARGFEKDTIAAQTDVPDQAPTCPICHQSDQVRTIQAAFDTGIEDIAPPAMPVVNARMAPWIIAGFAIYLAGNVYLFIELGANAGSPWAMPVQIASFVFNTLALLAGLVLSFIAVLRISRADNEATERYPAWDQAMQTWDRLYYCLRDNVAIDPDQHRVLSRAELRALFSPEDQTPRHQRPMLTHGDIHSVSPGRRLGAS